MTSFFDRLEIELMQAEERLYRRQRRRKIILAAAAAGVLVLFAATTVLVLGSDADVAASVRVERVGNEVEITLPSGTERATEVVDELRAAGLTVMTREVSTGPSRVGLVVTIGTNVGLLPVGQGEETKVRVPDGVVLIVGVGDVIDAERYEAFTDAFAPEEPLHCIGWIGQPALALASSAESLGFHLTIRDSMKYNLVDRGDLSRLVVVGATVVGSQDIDLVVSEGTPTSQGECR